MNSAASLIVLAAMVEDAKENSPVCGIHICAFFVQKGTNELT
jgi:hypothetical protein